eukprot:TRINITY_DN6796_c0_g3_i2.p3 TRINITY_DN6796_c0_g3~~TRINITY_DN6796_c0_g3_i2.p3  ORF type:complete len:187 (-),score=18.31 TRINITY_DN6796_c0_g3_i2:29-589(-)
MEDLAMAYVMLGVWVSLFVLFSWAYKMLELPNPASTCTSNQTVQNVVYTPFEASSSTTEQQYENKQLHEIDSENEFEDDQQFVAEYISRDEKKVPLILNQQVRKQYKFQELLWKILNKIFQFFSKKIWPFISPPFVAILISFLLGLFPPLQHIIFIDQGTFIVIGRTISCFGDAAIPQISWHSAIL